MRVLGPIELCGKMLRHASATFQGHRGDAFSPCISMEEGRPGMGDSLIPYTLAKILATGPNLYPRVYSSSRLNQNHTKT